MLDGRQKEGVLEIRQFLSQIPGYQCNHGPLQKKRMGEIPTPGASGCWEERKGKCLNSIRKGPRFISCKPLGGKSRCTPFAKIKDP